MYTIVPVRLYYFEIIGTAVFAVTGVLAMHRHLEMPDWLTHRHESSA